MLSNPIWGWILDRAGLRRGMTAAVAWWTLASVAHAFAGGFWSFGAARAALGLTRAGDADVTGCRSRSGICQARSPAMRPVHERAVRQSVVCRTKDVLANASTARDR